MLKCLEAKVHETRCVLSVRPDPKDPAFLTQMIAALPHGPPHGYLSNAASMLRGACCETVASLRQAKDGFATIECPCDDLRLSSS